MKTLFLGAAVLAFAACGSDTPDDPMDPDNPDNPDNPDDPDDPDDPDTSARDRDELASIIGGHVRGEFGLQLALADLSRGRPVSGFVINSATIEESHGTGAIGSMSYSFRIICHDAQIPHQPQFCDGTAHHSHVLLTATGSQSIGSMSMDGFNRTVDWEIRDVSLEKARFRGPDDISVTTVLSAGGESTTYKLSFDAVYEQVRYLAAQQVPTFGTIDFTVNVERTRSGNVRNFSAAAQLTYANGPATLVIDGSNNYSIDMTSGAATKL